MEKSENLYKNVYENLIEKGYDINSFEELIENIFSYKAEILDFKDPDPDDMLDMYEDEKIETDAMLLAAYNTIPLSPYNKSIIASNVAQFPYLCALKLNYKGNMLYIGYDFSDPNMSEEDKFYSGRYMESPMLDITLYCNVKNERRYQIAEEENADLSDENLEDIIINLESKLDELDSEEETHFKTYLSDLASSFGEHKTEKKFYPSYSFNEKLLDIVKTYAIPFNLALKDGILSISSELSIPEGDAPFSNNFIYELTDLIDQIFSLIDLINEYDYE